MSAQLSPSRDDVRERVLEIRRHLGIFSFQNDAHAIEPVIQNGSLPDLGIQPGGITEWLVAREGAGSVTAAMQIMSRSSGHRGMWAIVDPARECYVPALSGWGIEL